MDLLNKICTKCKFPKSIDEFHKVKEGKYGVGSLCKECRGIYMKIRYQNNREKILIYTKKYRKENKEKLKLHRKINKNRHALYFKNRRKNPIVRLSESISTNMRHSLKRNKNGYHWEKLVGYTLENLKNHLEKQFKNGMNWENFGHNGWVIDHRIPLSLFNITSTKSKGFKAAWKLENLQLLWEKDNFKKHNKIFQ